MPSKPSEPESDWKKLTPAISQKKRKSGEVFEERRASRKPLRRQKGKMFSYDVTAGKSGLLGSVESTVGRGRERIRSIADTERSARDEYEQLTAAAADRPKLLRVRMVVLAIAVPVLVLAVSIRAVATSGFLWLSYHRPGFPADSYGFTTDERMTYGSYGVNYILNFAPAQYLSGLKTVHGSRLFLPTEVQHMTDVKHVLIASMVFATVLFLVALLCSKGLSQKAPGAIRKALFSGTILTIVLMCVITVLALIGWESFFENFHHLFFPQGNWQFRMSDTLIRLYPPQFWVDAALAVVVLVALMLVALLLGTWPTRLRRAKELERLEERVALSRFGR